MGHLFRKIAWKIPLYLAVLCTAITITLVVMWTRSYLRADQIGYYWYSGHANRLLLNAWSKAGLVTLDACFVPGAADPRIIRMLESNPISRPGLDKPGTLAEYQTTRIPADLLRRTVHRLVYFEGIWRWEKFQPEGELLTIRAVFPFWAPLMLTSTICVVAIITHKRQRRVRDRLCLRCGYDLRASPERCPECGAQPRARRTFTKILVENH